MKKIYFSLLSLVAWIGISNAQNLCTNGRYSGDVYLTYSVTSDIQYGLSKALNNTMQIQLLDFYQPTGDTAQSRPLIIWAHGGSFFGGTKTDVDVAALSQRFTKKGFVCASINYRVGFTPFDSSGIVPALLRAVQDMKASIRFFYKDRMTANTYKIDTNNIFIGGSSAGAITALHAAYLNKSCEINPYINQVTLDSYGGIEGASGNQCYSSKVKGVINLCGALGKYGWLEPGDVPLCSMHGTADAVVIYGRGKANPGIPMLYLDGSRMIYAGTQVSGVNHNFYTWYGAPHVPYAGGSVSNLAYMDTTVNFVRDYLINRLGCPNPALLAPNTPAGLVLPYAYTTCTTNVSTPCNAVGIAETHGESLLFSLFPNPSNENIKIVFANNSLSHTIVLTDVAGKILRNEKTEKDIYILEKHSIASGIYFIKIIDSSGESSVHKLIFN